MSTEGDDILFCFVQLMQFQTKSWPAQKAAELFVVASAACELDSSLLLLESVEACPPSSAMIEGSANVSNTGNNFGVILKQCQLQRMGSASHWQPLRLRLRLSVPLH
jgi:hypothetical protein